MPSDPSLLEATWREAAIRAELRQREQQLRDHPYSPAPNDLDISEKKPEEKEEEKKEENKKNLKSTFV